MRTGAFRPFVLGMWLLVVAACGADATPAVDGERRAAPVALAGVEENTDSSAQEFWTAFREALLTNDTARVAAMTRFPLESRGSFDDDPPRAHARDELAVLVARLLEQESGMSAQRETMRTLVERTVTLGPRELGPEQIRVGALAFAKTGKEWKWVRAYTD